MIDLFTHGTPNGHKVSIALEELGLPYTVKPTNIFTGETQTPEFLALNPAGKIPTIRDTETGRVVTESCAILIYLAEKAGRLMPSDADGRLKALELLFVQASLQGPMFGQRAYFSIFGPEHVDHGIRRYEQQGATMDEVSNRLLDGRPHFLGDDYSIVDIAFFGWQNAGRHLGFDFADKPNLSAWFERVAARPAVQRGLTVPAALPEVPARRQATAA